MQLPRIIQGGMGVGISGWQLAGAVASAGQLGVVSGISLDEILIRRLQLGDPGGHMRRALSHFPLKDMAKHIIDKFFKETGKSADEPFVQNTLPKDGLTEEREDLVVAGSFAEIFLAREGHKGAVGVNLLEKIQEFCMPTLYGAMLAGVDFVTMGAGIPREIPGILDRFSKNLSASFRTAVTNALGSDDFKLAFDPTRYGQEKPLKRPKFLAIIASNVLALTLAKKSNGKVDGFIIEGPTAGGHNAPPRGAMILDENEEPVYGSKDEVDLEKIKELGLPFWLAGGYSVKGKLKEALDKGAQGIQAGTPFMLCAESGLTPELKDEVMRSSHEVRTDPYASPTGFPFKVALIPGTLSDDEVFQARPRICNLGYLREKYKKEDGSIGYRCSAEPVAAYEAKGGKLENALKSKCLCNALLANIGLGSVYKNGYHEAPLITIGNIVNDTNFVNSRISAKEVIDYLMEL